jgi:hypothetical protein
MLLPQLLVVAAPVTVGALFSGGGNVSNGMLECKPEVVRLDK